MASSTLDKKRKEKKKARRRNASGRSSGRSSDSRSRENRNSEGRQSAAAIRAEKKRRRRLRLIRLLRDLILLALVALIAYGGYHFFYDVFADEPVAVSEAAGVDITVRVDSGMSDLEVGQMLEKNGLVENAYVFFAQAKIFSDSGSSIQPGTYQLNTYMTAQEMLEVMTAVSEDASGDASET